ncbi:regulatory protein RecX [Allosphingosinicella indica]|uniref:regulatory protein RecX n=1 Tax=Allosphingosinicella indica TaxID=941907 RepID=UPI00313A122A
MRKLKERGWSGEGPAETDALCDKCVRLGFIDDAAFAAARATALGRRGYGARRVDIALRAAGVGEADGSEARAIADDGALAAAMRFAERKRIGPYASAPPDDAARRRQFAAMMRAGHPYDLVRKVLRASPDELEDEDLR